MSTDWKKDIVWGLVIALAVIDVAAMVKERNDKAIYEMQLSSKQITINQLESQLKDANVRIEIEQLKWKYEIETVRLKTLLNTQKP
ncbi:MAG: hypothetical protein WCO63_01195 [Bacteroidota bacterium]